MLLGGKFSLPVGFENYSEELEAMYCLSYNAVCTLSASRTIDILLIIFETHNLIGSGFPQACFGSHGGESERFGFPGGESESF